jgi:hypothetical protein
LIKAKVGEEAMKERRMTSVEMRMAEEDEKHTRAEMPSPLRSSSLHTVVMKMKRFQNSERLPAFASECSMVAILSALEAFYRSVMSSSSRLKIIS